MNKDEFLNQIDEWYDSDEHEKIIEAILALPEDELDDEILGRLAVAYNNNGDYKKAIAVLESQRVRLENWFKWQYRMGYALMNAADDEECENDETLRETILNRARVCFARCMNLNPPEDYLEECDMYIAMIEERLNEGEEDEDSEDFDPEMYDEDEADAIEEHIKEYFGEFPTVYHEVHSPDIHVDICCIPPSEERNYYTLVTMGMGAHIMTIPEELPKEEFGRAELVICLPPDWKLGETEDEWYWPIGLIKSLARLPLNCNTWLGAAHSVDNQEPFAPNTQLCASLLIEPRDIPENGRVCELPGGDKVRFFEVLPIYRTEMNFKIDHSAEQLLERIGENIRLIATLRPDSCPDYEINEKGGSAPYSGVTLDDGGDHARKVPDKNLPLDEITGYNHLSIYLRWMIEKKLYAPEFEQHYPNIVNGVINGTQTDLREFIRDTLDGKLLAFFFNYEGYCFSKYYYGSGEDESVYYPCDVDRYAESYFGTERYNSEEFQDEAYLFVPFDEDYYKGMSALIEKHYAEFRVDFDREQTEHCAEFAANVMRGLIGCPLSCVFPEHVKEARARYEDAVKSGKEKGFTAVYVVCDEDGDAETDEGLSDILSGTSFSSPLTIAHIPVQNACEVGDWLRCWFGASGRTAVNADASRFVKLYGAAPVIINVSAEAPVIYIPDDNGQYYCMTADPALNESGDDDTSLNLDKDGEEDLLPKLVNYLGCSYRLFAPAKDDRELLEAFSASLRRGAEEGFSPMLVPINGGLIKALTANASCLDDGEEFGFNKDALEGFRKKALAKEPSDVEIQLELILMGRRQSIAEKGGDFDRDIVGEMCGSEPLTRFLGYWDFEAQRTRPVLLAEIPVKRPWEIFAYLPIFGSKGTPTNAMLMGAAKHWHEKYGAVPATLGDHTLEFFVEKPVGKKEALPLALEMYALFPKLAESSKLGELAGSLAGSSVWCLYW